MLTEAVGRQEALEALAGPGTSLLTITEPTETATGAAFGYTAVLAGRPGNAAPLTEAGVRPDRAPARRGRGPARRHQDGTWNPLTATGATVDEARRLCADAVVGIRLALADARVTDRRLVDALLAGELRRSVRRTFGDARPGHCATHPHGTRAPGIAGPDASLTPVPSPARPEPGPGTRPGPGPRGASALAAAGLAATAGLIGIAGLCRVEDPYGPPSAFRRRRRGCGGCCCRCCECECCIEGCCEGCCEGCGECGCDGCCDC